MARAILLRRPAERGSTFVVVLFLVLAAAAIMGGFLMTSLAKVQRADLRSDRAAAWHAAEAGLNAGIEELWTRYRTAAPLDRVDLLDGIDGKYDAAERYTDEIVIGDRRVTITALESRPSGDDYADVVISARAAPMEAGRDGATRVLRAVVRYGRAPSRVFDHAYFINNFGWLWGGGITVNGDVRSNGDFSLANPFVNGDVFAARNDELGTLGLIVGASRNRTINQYNTQEGDQARPTNPSAPSEDADGDGELDVGEDEDEDGVLDLYDYEGGYDGQSERFPGQAPVEMPYLGDLTIYRNLAKSSGGTLRQGETVLVNAVLGDDVAEADHLILVGTEDDPIVIDGPVVVEGDVLIKGVITGRGTIYAGRNVHVIGDLEYANPPEWEKPLYDQETVKAKNAGKDLVGLVAKGSVILGNYTESSWKSGVSAYQKPPFTRSYEVDPTDDANGYVSYFDSDGLPIFDGDYTAYDGGEKDDGDGGTTARRFYESSFSDDLVDDLADSGWIGQVDAVLYTNHLLSGRIGNTTFNGALISRDEAILYSGSIEMNHDVRVRGNGYEFLDIWLPREPDCEVLYIVEGEE